LVRRATFEKDAFDAQPMLFLSEGFDEPLPIFAQATGKQIRHRWLCDYCGHSALLAERLQNG
jgi:hypothetical protein